MEHITDPIKLVQYLLKRSSIDPLLISCGGYKLHDITQIEKVVSTHVFNPSFESILYQGEYVLLGFVLHKKDENVNCLKYFQAFEALGASDYHIEYTLKKNTLNNKITTATATSTTTNTTTSVGVLIPEEIISLNIVDSELNGTTNIFLITFPESQKYPNGALVIVRKTSIQVAKHHLRSPITLHMSLSISTDSSSDYMAQSKTIRRILETYRYQPHVEPTVELSKEIIIENPYIVTSTSVELTSSCSSIWSITIENMRKNRMLSIQNLSIHLKATVRVDKGNIYEEVMTENVSNGSEKVTANIYSGSDGESGVYSAYSDDSILFNYNPQIISSDLVDKIFSVTPITTTYATTTDDDDNGSSNSKDRVMFPIQLNYGESYSLAFRVCMNESIYMKASIDDLCAQYLTPFSIWCETNDNSMNTSTLISNSSSSSNSNTSSLSSSSHRIFWSVGTKNISSIRSAISSSSLSSSSSPTATATRTLTSSNGSGKVNGKNPMNHHQQQQQYMDSTQLKLSDVICTIQYQATSGTVDIPMNIKILVENYSNQMLRQIFIIKRSELETSDTSSTSHCQYFIEHQDGPKSILPNQSIVLNVKIIPLLPGVVSFRDLVIRDLEDGLINFTRTIS